MYVVSEMMIVLWLSCTRITYATWGNGVILGLVESHEDMAVFLSWEYLPSL